MNGQAADYWTTTVNAQSYAGLQQIDLTSYFISLLLVLAVIALLAWVAYKLGWLKKTGGSAAQDDEVLFYACFGRDQKIMITRQQQQIICTIMEGHKTQLMTPLPGEIERRNSTAGNPAKKKRTFQAIWNDVLTQKRGKLK